jgi:Aspartyl protease
MHHKKSNRHGLAWSSLLLSLISFSNTTIAKPSQPIGEGPLLALDGYYACVNVRLKDAKDYPFIVDTGAFRTLVTKPFAEAKNFAVVQRDLLGSSGAVSRRKLYELGEVTVAGARWPQIRALEIPLKNLPCAPGVNAVGALGMDFLSQPVVEFDFPAQRIRIYQPKSFRYQGAGARVKIEKSIDFVNSLRVPVNVENAQGSNHELRLVLDTGAPSTVLSLAHGAGLDLGLFALAHVKVQGGGANGERHDAIITRVPMVRFGEDKMPQALTAVRSPKRGSAAVRRGYSGLLGLEWAKRRRWFLDYQRGQIHIEPGPAIAPTPYIGTNAYFDRTEAGAPLLLVRTSLVIPNGAVDLPKDLKLGDQLISINGRELSEKDDEFHDQSPWIPLTKPEPVQLVI